MQIAGSFLLSFLTALVLTPLVIKFAARLGILDDPRIRRHPATLHKAPTPRGGGIPVFLGVLFAGLLFLPINQRLLGILGGGAVAVLVGTLDDRYDLHPFFRLLTNFLAAGLVVASGIGIAFITNPAGGVIDLSQPQITFQFLGETRSIWLISDLLALFWIVFLMNMVNWSSGVDGQLAGFVPIAAATIGALSLRFTEDITQWPIIILAAATAGAYLGLLPYSVFPQRIMPGYGGGALAGFLLAVLAIASGAKLATAIIVLGVPFADAIFTIVRRLYQGKSPFWADMGHLHHRLLAAGWSKPKIAYFYWTLAFVLGFLALHLRSLAKVYTILLIGVSFAGLLLWLNWLLKLSRREDLLNG